MWLFTHKNERQTEHIRKQDDLRDIDYTVSDVYSWWRGTFVFMQRKRIKTWKGVAIIAFVAGVFSALLWVVTVHIEDESTRVNTHTQRGIQR